MPDSFHGGAGSVGPPLYDWMDAEVPDGRLLIGPTRGLPDSLRRYSLLHAGVPIWREPHVVGYINGLDEIGRARLRVALQSVEYHATNEDLPTRAGRALGNGTLTAVLIPRAVPPLVVPRTTISPAQGDGDPPGEPAQWSVTDRVAAMLRRTIPHLPHDMQQAARSLFTLENLYALAGFLVIWAAGHAAGYGEAIDLALLVIGYAMVGFSVFSGLNDLGHGVAMATTAKMQRDLDEAAKRTAAGLTTLTINALLALLTKLMPKAASGRAAPREEAPPPPPRDPPLPPKAVEPPPARTVLSGHGGYEGGTYTVQEGNSVTVYSQHGSTISDGLGNMIETNQDLSHIYKKTYLPGEAMPDYTLYPPDGLNIMGGRTVAEPTRLSELMQSNAGDVHWAACTFDETSPVSNIMYDTHGIFEEAKAADGSSVWKTIMTYKKP